MTIYLHRPRRSTFDDGPLIEPSTFYVTFSTSGNANPYFSIVVWVKGEKDKCVLRYT